MIVFKANVLHLNPGRVTLTLRADDEPIGQLILSPRVCKALVSRILGDDQKGDDHVILGPDKDPPPR